MSSFGGGNSVGDMDHVDFWLVVCEYILTRYSSVGPEAWNKLYGFDSVDAVRRDGCCDFNV